MVEYSGEVMKKPTTGPPCTMHHATEFDSTQLCKITNASDAKLNSLIAMAHRAETKLHSLGRYCSMLFVVKTDSLTDISEALFLSSFL